MSKGTDFWRKNYRLGQQNRLLLVLILLLLFFCVEPEWIVVQGKNEEEFPLTITDQFAREVTLKKAPLRIVTTSPANTEILFALGLGAEGRVVGVTNWCDYPPEVKAIEKIGDLTPLNLEKIISLRPDLVLASDINGQEAVENLTDSGIVVAAVNPTTIKNSLQAIELVGRLTGKTSQAVELIDRIKKGIARIQSRAKNLTKERDKPLKVLVILGDTLRGRTIWTAGPGTFLDEAITITGGENLGHHLDFRWAQLSIEYILKSNPDVIITGMDAEEFYQDELWSSILAVQKRQVYTININVFSRPGPRLLEAIEDLSLLMKESL
jgi:iron complex transport system substrate-binding protein